jgi:hypothetical protein
MSMDADLIPTWYQSWLSSTLAAHRYDEQLIEELNEVAKTFEASSERLSLLIKRNPNAVGLHDLEQARDHAAAQADVLRRAVERIMTFKGGPK